MKQVPAPFDGSWLVFAAALGFIAGMLVMAAVVVMFPAPLTVAAADVAVRPSLPETPPAVTPPPPPAAAAMPAIGVNPLEDLRRRSLTLPVAGIRHEDLRESFHEPRGGTRRHEAIDVLAPRHTPVVAVEDGTIARLLTSEAGGLTIYQFAPGDSYVYYYAHLERYADGLADGARVRRGQVIGYVGTTGNAPRDTPHLHFAIFRLTGEKKWWQGTAIDPYSVLR